MRKGAIYGDAAHTKKCNFNYLCVNVEEETVLIALQLARDVAMILNIYTRSVHMVSKQIWCSLFNERILKKAPQKLF